MNLVSQKIVYQYYREWRDGEQFRRKEVKDRTKAHKIVDTTGFYESIYRFGSFKNDMQGSYIRPFLLKEEDIKIDFKRYIRKTLRTVTVLKIQNYLNTETMSNKLKVVKEANAKINLVSKQAVVVGGQP